MPTNAPFPVNPQLTAIALSYRNTELVADRVLPRVDAHDEFRYTKFTQAEAFTVPDIKMGRKSEANEVEFSGTEVTDACIDYGLRDAVPVADIRKAEGTKMDPMGQATLGISRLIDLAREIRVAAMTFNANNYAAGYKVTLAGVTQWSDYTNSNPISAILTALDAMLMRANKMVLGQAVWTILRQHPKVVEAVKATGAGGVTAAGVVARQALADVLELQEIIVGTGWQNTAAKGLAPTMSRVWGKHCSLMYTEPVGSTQNATTFGFTASAGGGKRARDWFDDKRGTDGSQVVQVVDTCKEVMPATDLGYLFTNAVA
jgi:hypothetical protein